jgi:predicted transcriptional regulator
MQHTEIPNELSNRKMSIFSDDSQRTLKTGDKVIYASIRRFMNSETRECFPSIRKLKEKTGCSQNKIYDAINRLIEAGFIEKKKKLTPSGK